MMSQHPAISCFDVVNSLEMKILPTLANNVIATLKSEQSALQRLFDAE